MAALAEIILHPVDIVVEDKNDRLEAVASHDADFVEGELVRSVAGDHPGAAGLFGEANPLGGRGGPTDRAPESLAFRADALRKHHGVEMHHACARFDDEGVAGFQAPLEAGVEIGRGDLVVAAVRDWEKLDFFRDDRLLACLHLGEESGEHIVDRGVHEDFCADLHMVVPDGNHAGMVEIIREEARVEFGQNDAADVEHQVGAFDDLFHRGGGGVVPVVEAEELGDRLVEGAFLRRGDDGGKVDLGDEFVHLVAEAVAGGERGHDRHGVFGVLKARQNRANGVFKFLRNAVLALDLGEGFAGDRGAHDRGVTRKLGNRDVGGLAQAKGLPDDPLEFLDAVRRGENGGHTRRRAGDRNEAAVVRISEVVVGDEILNLDALAGHADKVKNRKAMGQASHDPVDGGKLADAVGRGEQRRATDARVAIRAIRGIQLVGANNPLEARNLLGGVIDGECVIAGNAKNLVDSELGQASEGVLGNSWVIHRLIAFWFSSGQSDKGAKFLLARYYSKFGAPEFGIKMHLVFAALMESNPPRTASPRARWR